MNEIKDNIVCSLPNISKEVLQKLITTIQELGVNEENDLIFVKKDDINTNVQPIEAWKLIKAWNSGKPNHYNVFLNYVPKLLRKIAHIQQMHFIEKISFELRMLFIFFPFPFCFFY